ncbi:MAG TPA: alpha/beta hydrolase [Candidatus Binataceae bacterium]|jgi:pimeloyl-ACP methyl ester carboxylesterase
MAQSWSEETVRVAGADLTMIKGGSGKPLLMLHDELGFPGWMAWNETLAHDRTFVIPLQPGYGKSPRRAWIRSYRDLGGFYAHAIRQLKLDPIDVIGFSAGGFAAAEMAAADPHIFSKMILVAPMGIKPEQGEIMDIFPVTIRTHLRATVADPYNTPEFLKIYGGEMTPEQFELFEEGRAEAARIGWEPYMHNPSLPHLLYGLSLPTLLVWGTADKVVPRGCIELYKKSIAGAQVAEIEGAGHRPEIENSPAFERAVTRFLAA